MRICSLLLNTSDPFVREAVISVVTGLGLHSKDWKTLKKCIDILEKYLQNHTTTNVVLLDDLETLYSYAEVTFRQLHNRELLYKYADVKWSDKIEKKWALFSVMKDKETGKYSVFFQAKDMKVMDKAFKHALSESEKKTERKESIHKNIEKFKEMAKNSLSKDKVKNKQKEQSL